MSVVLNIEYSRVPSTALPSMLEPLKSHPPFKLSVQYVNALELLTLCTLLCLLDAWPHTLLLKTRKVYCSG